MILVHAVRYKKELTYLKTIKDELLVSPNDLVLLNDNQFYLTNDHGSGLNTCKIFEDFMIVWSKLGENTFLRSVKA